MLSYPHSKIKHCPSVLLLVNNLLYCISHPIPSHTSRAIYSFSCLSSFVASICLLVIVCILILLSCINFAFAFLLLSIELIVVTFFLLELFDKPDDCLTRTEIRMLPSVEALTDVWAPVAFHVTNCLLHVNEG
ncbi:hypothetical protein Dimus_023975 [Dionaea muscipula]